MIKEGPTKEQDMYIAKLILENYAQQQNTQSLGLFELYVDEKEKSLSFRLSSWVIVLSQKFTSMYGADKGDFVTRQVISRCITQGQTLH